MTSTDPIFACLDQWMLHLRGELDGGLDAILHPDVVFLSPVVFTPQRGRDITKLYLGAAGNTLGGGSSNDATDLGDDDGAFHYTKIIREGHHAMLEFETTMHDPERDRPTTVNGIDLITCDDAGLITEFKVMLRPLQAVNIVHAAMKQMLEQMS